MTAALRTGKQLGIIVPLIVAVSLSVTSLCCSAEEDSKSILDNLERLSDCLTRSSFSYIHNSSLPPRTSAELKTLCKSQIEALKCLREKSKGSPALVRRGLLAYVNGRQPHNRKYCTNFESELSKKFVAATKCVLEKKLDYYKKSGLAFEQSVNEIYWRNYNDSTIELKQICCSMYRYKQATITGVGPECEPHRAILEELAETTVAQETRLICDDDEKLAKICPKLEPVTLQNPIANQQKKDPALLMLYLFATLGEPDKTLKA